jgi:hypothetical protein
VEFWLFFLGIFFKVYLYAKSSPFFKSWRHFASILAINFSESGESLNFRNQKSGETLTTAMKFLI